MADKICKERICFFNKYLIEQNNTDAEFVMHKPEKAGYCMTLNEAWEGEGSYLNIFWDNDRWRLYYNAGKRVETEVDENGNSVIVADRIGDDFQEACKLAEGNFKICMAESIDGINWIKPNLGLCDYKGSKNNNIIIYKPESFFVMKDDNPDCKASERYKAIYNKNRRLYSMFSSDGIHFREGGIISENGGMYDTHDVVYYDKNLKRYVSFVRGVHKPNQEEYPFCDDKEELERIIFVGCETEASAHINGPIRDIRVMYSEDFINWSIPKRINIENDDGTIHYYTNGAFIYPRSPRYFVGLPQRYIDYRPYDENYKRLCGYRDRMMRYPLSPRYASGITDGVFISSVDGENWEKSDGAYVRVGQERKDGWVYGDCAFSPNAIETENQLYGYKEYSLYCLEGYWGNTCRVMRYTIRLDGFASYHAGEKVKKVVTKPFIYEGDKLIMNFSTSSFGYIKVTLKDENGDFIESEEIFGDDTDKEIWFKDENAIRNFAGKTVTMTVAIFDADVFSFKFE